MRKLRYLSLILLGIALVGCKEDYPVYSSFCEQNSTEFPPCLRYVVLNSEDKKRVQSTLGIRHDDSCPYRVELTRYHVGACNNLAVKSFGSDFDGYVRLEIKKSFKCYYKAQSDFKSDENAAFERVLKKINEVKKNSKKSN